jgi:hypothetical protein
MHGPMNVRNGLNELIFAVACVYFKLNEGEIVARFSAVTRDGFSDF